MELFAEAHQAEASVRYGSPSRNKSSSSLKIKEQGQHQFIADIDLVLLLIPLIQSLFLPS
jgi:hypothetical protein